MSIYRVFYRLKMRPVPDTSYSFFSKWGYHSSDYSAKAKVRLRICRYKAFPHRPSTTNESVLLRQSPPLTPYRCFPFLPAPRTQWWDAACTDDHRGWIGPAVTLNSSLALVPESAWRRPHYPFISSRNSIKTSFLLKIQVLGIPSTAEGRGKRKERKRKRKYW